MQVLAISHQRDAGPGVFADAITQSGGELAVWHRAETDEPPIDPLRAGAVIVLGGAMHPDQEGIHPWLAAERELIAELLAREVPLLGVCLGAQLLAHSAGGGVRRARHPEIGWFEVEVTAEGREDPLLGPLAPRFEAFEWHSYECTPPPGAIALARTELCLQAFAIGERCWGIQFHAEVSAADALRWIDEYRVDPDAVAMRLDYEAVRRDSVPRLPAWNRVGADLCRRFVGLATS
jgi:GMP synthase-like glutamine amidotransferase